LHGGLEGLERGILRLAPGEGYIVVGELGQRGGDLAEILDELAVVAGGAEERTNVGDLDRSRPILHGLDLVLHHPNTLSADVVAEELDLILEEVALG